MPTAKAGGVLVAKLVMKLYPPLAGDLTHRRLNRTLHGRSVHRPGDVPGHNVVRGYKDYPRTGDGGDLFGPSIPGTSVAMAGEPVYAMHDGVITRIADRGGRLSCLYVVAPGLLTVYAHVSIKPALDLKSAVTRAQVIGYIADELKDPHLHLELWVGGNAVTGSTPWKWLQNVIAVRC